MCSSHNSYSNTNMIKQRKHFPLERRPRMLKDFLADDFGSCSPSGFKSFPRTVHSDSCLPILTETSNVSNNITNNGIYSSRINPRKLLRSRSISAFQAMINAVKNIHFSAAKSPSILPRSLSRRLSKRRLQRGTTEIKSSVVTVKDIIRWRSFRDIAEEKQEQYSTPFDYTTTTTTTTIASTATTPSSSNASSWCDSDFTSEYLPVEYVQNENGKKYLPCVGGGDLVETIKNYRDHDSKVDEEKHLHSPVSVIDFELFEDEESTSSFDQALANVERTKDMLMQKIRKFESLAYHFEPLNLEKYMSMDQEDGSSEEEDDEDKETERSYQEEEEHEVEEKVWQLLNYVKTTSRSPTSNADELLLLDFFKDELGPKRENTYNIERRNNITEFYGRILDRAEGWINGESNTWVGLKEEYKRGTFWEEMNKGGMWNDFEEEKEELALAIESDVVGTLVDEILLDLISCKNLRQT